ncbi:MAG: M14 family metallopeptidase, partial [Calditrichaeota bacterium]|nr:M14 family metallopeptidase [Calditrichota bacterium]
DGKDAGLALIRDLVVKKQNTQLLDNLVILFIPVFNADGHERSGRFNRINQNGPEKTGWRTTAQNLNLNRDYLKADAPEMRAWLKLFTRWLPDFFVDCHVTDGADYQYAVTYHLDSHGILDSKLVSFIQTQFVPPLKKMMSDAGFPLIDYVMFRNRHDPRSGTVTWATSPRFSNGYTDIRNRPGLLVETHALKDYKTRVTATYRLLQSVLTLLNNRREAFKKLIREADRFTAGSEFRESPYTLTYRLSKDSVMIDFSGFEYQKIRSDLSGGIWFRYDSSKPKIFKIPFFNKMTPDKSVRLPVAYIIPVEWQSVIKRLPLHGIKYFTLTKAVTLKLDTYRFSDVKFNSAPYEGRQMARFKTTPVVFEREYRAGSAVVPLNQPTAKVIAHILEPDAPDSYVRWGFFNTIFEQKEYAESYVLEALARKMLKENPQLKNEFRRKLQSDSAFAKNPRAVLQWFYRKSPYWDRFKDVYPVGRIFNHKIVENLPLN